MPKSNGPMSRRVCPRSRRSSVRRSIATRRSLSSISGAIAPPRWPNEFGPTKLDSRFRGNDGTGISPPFQLVGREPQRRDEVRIGLVASAQPAEHLAQRQMRAPVIVQGDACLEIRLRLTPELLALAERSQHAQQRRVLIVRGEPTLGLLDLPRGVGDPALAVELDEFGIPFAFEAPGDDL